MVNPNQLVYIDPQIKSAQSGYHDQAIGIMSMPVLLTQGFNSIQKLGYFKENINHLLVDINLNHLS